MNCDEQKGGAGPRSEGRRPRLIVTWFAEVSAMIENRGGGVTAFTCATVRGGSFWIARGAVNGAVIFRNARESKGRDVTSDPRIASSAVLRGRDGG